MFAWYFLLEKYWFKLPEKIRFLLVGSFNTVIAYGLFSFLYFVSRGNYAWAAFLQYVLTVQLSFLTMRYYVFRGKGPFLKEYIKTISVYIWLLFFNMAWLFVLIDGLNINAYLTQGLYIIMSVVLTYLFHKYFSFKIKEKTI